MVDDEERNGFDSMAEAFQTRLAAAVGPLIRLKLVLTKRKLISQ